jgi:hypothetical protein
MISTAISVVSVAGGLSTRSSARARLAAVLLVALTNPAMAFEPIETAGGIRFTPTLDALSGGFVQDGAWFGLADLTDPTFDDRRAWLEGWVEAGFDVTAPLGGTGAEVYGRLGIGASGTLGSDPFDQTDQGAIEVENLFAGVRRPAEDGGWWFDLSYGHQDYGVGTGMLIWQGAGNGFERGAVGLLPRTAWEQAGLARVGYDGHTVEAFFLDPNELASADTGTQLAGATWHYEHPSAGQVGLAYVNVLRSDFLYPVAAPPFFIADGRDGLQAVEGYARIAGEGIGLPGAWVRGDAAYQWKDDVSAGADLRAFAVFGEAGYRFATLPFAPTLSYGFATFSGDDPSTGTVERFDPLYYGNGLDNWWFGANGSYAYLNSNVSFHRLSLQVAATERDFLKLQLVRALANERGSPIQFGYPGDSAGGFPGLQFGVDQRHLSDEIYAEWTRLFTPTTSVTLWGSVAFPGDGIDGVTPGGDADAWLSSGLLLSARF